MLITFQINRKARLGLTHQKPQMEPQYQPQKPVSKHSVGKPSLPGAAISKKNSGTPETIKAGETDPVASATPFEATVGAYPEIVASLKDGGSIKPTAKPSQATPIAIGMPKKKPRS